MPSITSPGVSSYRVRAPREETYQRPDGQVQDSGEAGGQRVRRCDPEVWPDAPADHGRGESDLHSKDPLWSSLVIIRSV